MKSNEKKGENFCLLLFCVKFYFVQKNGVSLLFVEVDKIK